MTATKAEIAKASSTARAKMAVLERETIAGLSDLYSEAAETLQREISRYGDAEGNLRLTVLRDYLQQVQAVLRVLGKDRNALLDASLLDAAELGAAVWLLNSQHAGAMAESAVRFVEHFIAADGLTLSNRLWRIDNSAVQTIADVLRRNVALGRSASAAVADLLARGDAVPAVLRNQMDLQGVEALGKAVSGTLWGEGGNAYTNALRVFRTELNRAHGHAYQAGASSHPDVIGMKFNLSPAHPKTDQCDLHARANLHGLGAGVYPVGQSPWPAHPNTMSYLTAVFRDEVSAEDRAGQQNRLDWLRDQPATIQEGLLGRAKAAALRAGVLGDQDINTPWRDLKEGYERRGYQFG